MIITYPLYLSGEAGATLDTPGYPLKELGIFEATLYLRSLDKDELEFSLKNATPGSPIPQDDQWVTLSDATGKILFSGVCKRTIEYPSMIYRFVASGVYEGMLRTPLLEDGRAFVSYEALSLGQVLTDMISRGSAVGLPIQAPGDMPEFFTLPKNSHRATTIAAAMENVIKWAPDACSRMDYSTNPPTMRITSRASAEAVTLDFYHKQITENISLQADQNARALYLRIAYSVRGDDGVTEQISQEAGDPDAQAFRSVSVFLSGPERVDMLASEALAAAQYAESLAKQVATATSTSISSKAQSGVISAGWAWAVTKDSNLAGAAAAQSGFSMQSAAGTYFHYWPMYKYGQKGANYKSGVYVGDSYQNYLRGWYPIEPGTFTDEQLALAGVISRPAYICGNLVRGGSNRNVLDAGMYALFASAGSQCEMLYYDHARTPMGPNYYFFYRLFIPIIAINMPVLAVADRLKTSIAASRKNLPARADFAEAPVDFARNCFDHQNWVPYRGEFSMIPGADFPVPGDFLNIRGEAVPDEWTTMKTPVSQVAINLQSGAPTITLGPSQRMDYSHITDRLRIPQEDNYKAG